MSQGKCAPYSGKVCKHYLAGAGQVWFNSSDSGGRNENITAGLWDEMIRGLKEPCRTSAEVSFIPHQVRVPSLSTSPLIILIFFY